LIFLLQSVKKVGNATAMSKRSLKGTHMI